MTTTISDQVGFWDITEVVTLQECNIMAEEEGIDIRIDNGRAYIPIYEKQS